MAVCKEQQQLHYQGEMGKKLAPVPNLLLIYYLIYYTHTLTHTHTLSLTHLQVGKKLALTLKVLQLQKEHADKVEQVLLIVPQCSLNRALIGP